MGRGLNFAKRIYRWGHSHANQIAEWFDMWRYAQTEGKQLRALKDIYAGRRCFVIGNGPSLKKHDLTKLSREKKFATNMFFLHPDLDKIHLDFFCSSDPIHWQSEGGFLDSWKRAFQRLPYCLFFFERSCIPIYKKTKELQDRHVYFLHLDMERHAYDGDFSVDVASYVSWGANVIVDFCLPLAYHLGFNEVFLLGCDCDYKTDEAPDLSQAHFYDRNLDPRKLPPDTGDPLRVKRMMDSYRAAKRVFEADGRTIYNAGYGGKLEVFERVNYDDLF